MKTHIVVLITVIVLPMAVYCATRFAKWAHTRIIDWLTNSVKSKYENPVPIKTERKSDEELHYKSLLDYFKHLVWAMGILLTVAATFAGYLFHKDFQQARNDAMTEARNQANEASQKEINTIFTNDAHLQTFIEQTMTSIVDKRITDVIAVGQRDNLALTIIQAQNDDRGAFDKLVNIQHNETNKYIAKVLSAVIDQINNQLMFADMVYSHSTLDWHKYGFDPRSASFDTYLTLYNTNQDVGTHVGPFILKTVATNTTFPAVRRTALYRDAIEESPSLQVEWTACLLVDFDAGLHLGILGATNYLRWLETNRGATH